jgi:hypothetical protein
MDECAARDDCATCAHFARCYDEPVDEQMAEAILLFIGKRIGGQ